MSYPNDAPATQMSGYWSDGAYTPGNTVAYIKDDVTPINKNAMVNSVGKQLSLIQNFVNKTYLARPGDYIGDGYITNMHVDYILGSGYVDASNVGFINLCSQLLPANDGTLNLGEFRNGLTRKWKSVASNFGYFASLSGYANPGGGGPIYSGGYLRLDSDLAPLVDATLSIGTASNRFGTIQSSGFVGEVVQTDYLLSPNFVSTASPGTVFLCSHLKPNFNTLELGGIGAVFKALYIKDIYCTTTQSSANGSQVWVDATGYLRVG